MLLIKLFIHCRTLTCWFLCTPRSEDLHSVSQEASRMRCSQMGDFFLSWVSVERDREHMHSVLRFLKRFLTQLFTMCESINAWKLYFDDCKKYPLYMFSKSENRLSDSQAQKQLSDDISCLTWTCDCRLQLLTYKTCHCHFWDMSTLIMLC